MENPIAAWHAEHVYFGQLLELLRRELDVFHRGERPNYQVMQDIVTYLRDYSDQYHHPREDEAFARLARRCPDMELPLARLQQEHRVIAHAGATLLQQIDAILEDAIVPRAEVEMALATYLVCYGNHIAKEEEDVLTRGERAHCRRLESGEGSGTGRTRSALRRQARGALPGAAPPDRPGGLTKA